MALIIKAKLGTGLLKRPRNSAINTKPQHKAIIYCVASWTLLPCASAVLHN